MKRHSKKRDGKKRNSLKKLTPILTVLIAAAILASCMGDGKNEAHRTQDSQSETVREDTCTEKAGEEKKEKTEPFKLETLAAIEKQVIFDDKGIKITALELDYTGFSGPSVRVLIENGSGHYISLKSKEGAVNGAMVSTNFTLDISEGSTEENGIVFSKADLEKYGITVLERLEFGLLISNSLNWESIAEVDSVEIKTDAEPTNTQLPTGFDRVIYDNGGVRVSVKTEKKASSMLGAKIFFCVENKTDKDITVHARGVKADATAVNPTFSRTVNGGKYVIDELEFMDSELKLLRIDGAKELSLKFAVTDPETKETLLETENVTFSLEN